MRTAARCILLAGLAFPAFAQDSVSTDPLGPGDATSAYDLARQLTKYTVDLTAIESGGGITYGIAPVVKSSAPIAQQGAVRSASFLGQAMSRRFEPATLAGGQYASWSAPGQGVGPNNTAGAPVDLPITPLVSLAAGFADTNAGQSNIIGALITLDPDDRSRVYIDRYVAASSSPDGIAAGSANLSFGAIDSRLNIAARADGVGALGTSPVTRQDILRIDTELRNTASVNPVDDSGPADPAALLAYDGSDLLGTNPVAGVLLAPSLIPEADGGPVTFGANTSPDLLTADHAAATTAQLTPDPAFVGLVPNAVQRGSTGYAPVTPLGGVGTGVAVQGSSADDITGLAVFGLDASGTPTSVATFQMPATIQDTAEPYDLVGAPVGNARQTAGDRPFTGSAGAASITTDAAGRVLASAVVDLDCATCTTPLLPGSGAGSDNARSNAVAVLRFDPADPAATQAWTLAAWTNADTGLGKTITNDEGTPIGMLTTADADADSAGPSISGVALDAFGNALFTAPFVDFGADEILGTLDDIVRTGFFRAVYDPATFAYTLDLLVATGDTVLSQGTGLNYRIELLPLAAGGTTDPAAFGAQNATHAAYPGAAPTEPGEPDTLGAATLAAVITYDTNADGLYDTGPATQDESYAALLLVTPLEQPTELIDCNENGIQDADDIAAGTSEDINADAIPDECQITRLCADTNNDGTVDVGDFFAWVAEFGSSGYRADQNGDGFTTESDFFAWVVNFNLGSEGPLCLE